MLVISEPLRVLLPDLGDHVVGGSLVEASHERPLGELLEDSQPVPRGSEMTP